MSSRAVDALALAEWVILAPQERVVLSEMLELVSLVRPSTLYGRVPIERRYFIQSPATGTFDLSLDDKTCQPVSRHRY